MTQYKGTLAEAIEIRKQHPDLWPQKKPTTVNPTTGELEADFIRRQLTITETPARTIPAAGLKPKRAQNDAPLALEMPAIEKAQGRLF